LQRSEITQPKEPQDSTSSLLMMMWSVALSGSNPCVVPSRKAIQALADLHSFRESFVKTGTSLNTEYSQDYYHHAIQGSSLLGGCTPKRLRKKIVNMMDQSIILKLATWLLKRKRSGA